jgi:hypothetical protein
MHRIKTLTKRNTMNLSLDELIHALNPTLRGWANYHRHKPSKRCFAYVSYYLWWRVIRWLRAKYPRLTWKQVRRRYWGDRPRGREALLARRGRSDPISLSRPPHPLAVGAPPGTGRATTRPGGRHCLTSAKIKQRLLWRAGCTGMGMSGVRAT